VLNLDHYLNIVYTHGKGCVYQDEDIGIYHNIPDWDSTTKNVSIAQKKLRDQWMVQQETLDIEVFFTTALYTQSST
jgi:hypothetical protein